MSWRHPQRWLRNGLPGWGRTDSSAVTTGHRAWLRRGLVVVALVSALAAIQRAGWQEAVDGLFYDFFLRHLTIEISPEIEVIEIDQRSLEALGRWPWRREVHARLLERLGSLPTAIGVDINFAEPDREHPADDQRLVNAVAVSGKVVLPVVLEQRTSRGPLKETLPMRPLALAAAALGHVEVELGDDGIARAIYLLAGLDTPRWPAFGLAMMQVAGLWSPGDRLPGRRSPIQVSRGHWVRDHRLLVPLPKDGAFPHFSYVDVLNGDVPAARFAGKYILIGAVASGMGDTLPTPISVRSRPTSGLHYSTSVLNGLLTGQMIRETPPMVILALAAAVAALVLLPVPGRVMFLLALGLLAVVPVTAYAMLQWQHRWLPPALPLLAALAVLGWSLRLHMQRLFEKLRRQHGVVRATLDSVDDAVLYLDRSGRIVQHNEAADRLLERAGKGRLVGHRLQDLVMFQARGEDPQLPDLDRPAPGGRLESRNLTLISGDGRRTQVNMVVTAIPWSQGERLVVLADLSREQALTQALEMRRSHDPETGLPNRHYLRKRLEAMLRRAESWRGRVAVVHLGMDDFAQLEQLLGHEAGEEVRQVLARRLQSLSGRGVEIGDLGRGEFLVLFEGRQPEKRLEELHELMGKSLEIGGQRVRPAITLGVSLFPDNPVDADELMHQAALALEQGRRNRPGGITLFQGDMKKQAARRLVVRRLLDTALEEGRLETFYQPVVALRDGRIRGVECLMRLRDEEGEYLSTAEFLPAAETSGLIKELAHHQLYEACLQLRVWKEKGLADLRLSYNLSARQLHGRDFPRRLRELLSVTGFDPRAMELDVPEALLDGAGEEDRATLEQLAELGVGLVLDDFDGHPRLLAQAEKLAFGALKIDRAVVQDLGDRPGAGAITTAIINMGHGLGMRVIAKGVENPRQFQQLTAQHCDEAQGFYLGKPMPAARFEEHLRRHGARFESSMAP